MLHIDEARERTIEQLAQILDDAPERARAVLIEDLFGRFRVVLWEAQKDSGLSNTIRAALEKTAGPYWTSEIWLASGASRSDQLVYEKAWKEAQELKSNKLRMLDRHRARGGWLTPVSEPPWPCRRATSKHPAVVVFYSFKGGVGRTTALASFAIQRARQGERVVVIDGDLDAPGVGTLLAADAQWTTARWGVADYLLERPLGEVDLSDYYHACRRDAVTGPGEILVVPAGQVNQGYLGKLARIDLEPSEQTHPLTRLLEEVRRELAPQWILLDSRAGLDDPSGLFLSGMAHLHVLFATFSDQSWNGLRLILDRLGAKRVLAGKIQADCLLVQAMVPESQESSRLAREAFAERAQDELIAHYYASEEESDEFWTLDDIDSRDAPHVPVPIHYMTRLSFFRDIEEIADILAQSPDHVHLAERIESRFQGTKS